jgi:hypothetical protein
MVKAHDRVAQDNPTWTREVRELLSDLFPKMSLTR